MIAGYYLIQFIEKISGASTTDMRSLHTYSVLSQLSWWFLQAYRLGIRRRVVLHGAHESREFSGFSSSLTCVALGVKYSSSPTNDSDVPFPDLSIHDTSAEFRS